MNKIMHIVGARPNFMKIAPIIREMADHPAAFEQVLVHTGQHYDHRMSDVFFEDLEIPAPDVNLEVGSGSQAWQVAQVMLRFEPVLLEYRPDWVVVVGDVNSTIACAMVCAKLGVKIAHVEAGLRSFDRSMPEEVNRILTDQLSTLLLTPSADANENLLREGIDPARIALVGNVMIDSVVRALPVAEKRHREITKELGVERYVLATLHRPSNVDSENRLREIAAALNRIAVEVPVIFPVHPRTRQRLIDMRIEFGNHVHLIEPRAYIDFLALQAGASLVLTDSGGVQEETTYLGVPCLTLRPNTERPVTISCGTNQLVRPGENIFEAAAQVFRRSQNPPSEMLPFWDGKTAGRITQAIAEWQDNQIVY
jgi:UDP-N-acetylglucosamine 2-epimerase (non-hydrolysing)